MPDGAVSEKHNLHPTSPFATFAKGLSFVRKADDCYEKARKEIKTALRCSIFGMILLSHGVDIFVSRR